jgi:hypothetical protein
MRAPELPWVTIIEPFAAGRRMMPSVRPFIAVVTKILA